MKITVNRAGTVTITMPKSEAAALYGELLWVKNVDEDGAAMTLWNKLSDAGLSDD